jgi:hypothetical protein
MDRREWLGLLGVGSTGLLAAGAGAAEEPRRFVYHSMLDKTHVDCLDACSACAAVCNEMSHHCFSHVEKGSSDKEFHARGHHMAADCATICSVSAALVARQSPMMDVECTACAEACRRCAEHCEKSQDSGGIAKDCARICRECERACREMVRSMGGARSGDGR